MVNSPDLIVSVEFLVFQTNLVLQSLPDRMYNQK